MDQKQNVIETAAETGNFRVFLQALEAAGLKQTLGDAGPLTIFAPTDDAFAKIPQPQLEHLFKRENRDLLRVLLTNHIVPGQFGSSELKSREQIKTMKGENLRVDSRLGLWINEANVVFPDLEGSNGVVHGIDMVLMPQNQVAATT